MNRVEVERHLRAYRIDSDPKHIARAWRVFRKAKVQPDNAMLAWVDRLVEDVLNPTKTMVRPKENTLRDSEIQREVRALLRANEPRDPKGYKRKRPLKFDDACAIVARDRGLTGDNVKVIVHRVEHTQPRARR